jgi:thiamine-phosphate pyrophosphorylase
MARAGSSARPRWRGLYAIVDPERCGGRDPEALADAILSGGCAVLQLRAKTGPRRTLLALAKRLAERCRRAGVPFVVNDHLDLAWLVSADGLHLGQDDLPVGAARRLLGEDRPVGVSTHDLPQLARAVDEGADLVGFGPVFPTGSKAQADPVVGLPGLARACAESPVPVVAIGGLTLETAAAAARAGAPLVAVISALARSPDPAATAAALHREVLRAAPEPERGPDARELGA